MPTVAMSGNDTISINNVTYADLAEGTVVELTFPNDIADVKTGKNGNSVYGLNEMGNQCEVKMRLIKGSADDKRLNGLLKKQINDFSAFPLMIGSFIKIMGDGKGNVTNDIYVLSGGIFTKNVEAKSSVEGDTEQSVSVYTMKFSRAPRAIG